MSKKNNKARAKKGINNKVDKSQTPNFPKERQSFTRFDLLIMLLLFLFFVLLGYLVFALIV